MATNLDDQTLFIPCPNCGHEIAKTVSWRERNDKLTCPECYYITCLKPDEFVPQPDKSRATKQSSRHNGRSGA